MSINYVHYVDEDLWTLGIHQDNAKWQNLQIQANYELLAIKRV
jgi:hypothetical protein